jgi:hypothetical protein
MSASSRWEGVAPDLIDAVVGFRQWRLDAGRLRSPYCSVLWHTAELSAHCPLGRHDPATTPDASCSCGIYAYYEPCPRTASAATSALISGAVILWGAIELHAGGMRAAHCRIVAVALPLSRGRKRSAARAAAGALDVPIVAHRHLTAQALIHGQALPSSLRPARSHPLGAGRGDRLPTATKEIVSALSDDPEGEFAQHG